MLSNIEVAQAYCVLYTFHTSRVFSTVSKILLRVFLKMLLRLSTKYYQIKEMVYTSRYLHISIESRKI